LKTVEKLEKFDKDTKEKKDVFSEITFKLNTARDKNEQVDLPAASCPISVIDEDGKFKHISELN